VEEAQAGQTGGLSRRIIERPRLTRLLDGARGRRILLVAPAGFGKTTLARQWIEQGRRSVWFRATPASVDVAALALGLSSALEEIAQGVSERVQERLGMSHSPNSEAQVLGRVLAEDLAAYNPDAWLVIDDYQHLAIEPAAETFMEAFASHATVPMLLTSRIRPNWVSAKQLLYGEVAEFGRNILAMTHEEAALATPPDIQPGTIAGLVALAEGWPAVIGLASLVASPLHLTGGEMPQALHAYFAEELYQGLDKRLQWNLVQLSLASTIDDDLATRLFGAKAATILGEAHERGFLNRDGEAYELHPLLRQFLKMKLPDAKEDEVLKTVETIALCALQRSAWDEAFLLASDFGLQPLLIELLNQSLDDLLAKGRLATLQQWLDEARRTIPGEEIVSLAEIELAFRRGRRLETEEKARRLARRLPQHHPFASRALFRAAQVAQLDDRHDEAFALLTEARTRSTTTADLRRSLWSRFITLGDLEEPELAAETLTELEALAPESIEDMIHLSQGPLHYAVRWGGLREALDLNRDALRLLDKKTDPLVRTGFLQSYGTALALAARYEEARDSAERQLADAERCGLDWVRPHGLELLGLAEIGLKEFRSAERRLRDAYELAEQLEDHHAQANALGLLARIPLSQGDPSTALDILKRTRDRAASPGMEAELRSLRALVLASAGSSVEAAYEIRASESLSAHLEARCLRAYASAIAAREAGDDSHFLKCMSAALGESRITGNLDSLVTAYRAVPAILTAIAELETGLDDFLLQPIVDYDTTLASKAGLTPIPKGPTSRDMLTEREKEVLALLRRGLSNREIAHALWIAESTAKVHVRHIFEKLGVRSRTEAALFLLDGDS
jgi:ATP/maltotriose-dependent transcriptional regulator MalT